MRDSFIFYRSFYEAIRDLPRDIQGEIYTAIMEYGLYGNETDNLKPVARSIFTLIKPNLEANIKRYENGCKGGRPKKDKPNENQTETKQNPNKDKDYNDDKDEDLINIHGGESVRKKTGTIDFQEIVERFNATLSPPLPKVITLSETRKHAIKARIKEHGREAVMKVFENVKASSFLRGETERGWKCYFDWIFNPRNFLKILEGNYANIETTHSEKQRANEYALQKFITDRAERQQGMANEMEDPF